MGYGFPRVYHFVTEDRAANKRDLEVRVRVLVGVRVRVCLKSEGRECLMGKAYNT